MNRIVTRIPTLPATRFGPLPAYFAVAVVALIAGGLAAVAPWWMIAGGLGGAGAVALTFRDPFLGVMLTLSLAAQAIPGALLPAIPLGGALIQPAEIMCLVTAAACANVTLARWRDFHVGENWDLIVSTLVCLAVLIVSIAVSAYSWGQRGFAYPLLRNFLPLTLLPFLPSVFAGRERIARAERLFILFGVLIAAWIAIQAFTGTRLLGGRLEDLGLMQTTGIARTVLWGPELLVILALLLIAKNGFRFVLSRWWPAPAVAILLLGLMGTYTRSFWIATVVATAALASFVGGIKGALRLAALAIPTVLLAWGAVYVANPHIAEAAVDRAFGITREIESGDSFGWRGKENAMAMEAIAKHPVLGIGLNGVYKPSISSRGHFEGEEVYIHNAYLYFQLKMGLIGSLIPLIFLWLYLRLSRSAFSIAAKDDRAGAMCYVSLGIVVMLIGYSGQTISRFVTLLIVCLMFTVMRSYAARN